MCSNQIQVATHAGVQAKAGPTAVHVGAAHETQLQTVDQNMADAQTDHDMDDVAVVEHPHPHEDEEHVEWEHPEKVYFDEDDGTNLDPVQVRAGVEREMAFMGELGVGEPCDRPKTVKVWSTRWCYRRKGDTVRSRLVVRQFREGTDPSVHAGTPGPAAMRILLTLSAIYSLFAATADFSVAFMHTPMTEEVFVEPQEEANLPLDTVGRLRRALNGLRCAAAAFQAYLESLLEDVGFRRGMTAPSIYNREDDGVKMSVHADDPLVIGPEGLIRILFEWLGQLIAVKGLETFDSVRGLKNLGMVYYTIPGGTWRQLLQVTSKGWPR